MTNDSLYVNADWSALVPAGSAEAAFGIQAKDAKRLGLLLLAADEADAAPPVMTSANIPDPAPTPGPERSETPEPTPAPSEAKEADAPADKQAARPADKARRRPRRK